MTTTVHGTSRDAVGSVDSVEHQDIPLVPEDMLDPVDVIMHDEPKEVDMDLLSRIHGLYRLLDLISEQGSGGAGMMIASSMAQRELTVSPLRSGQDHYCAGVRGETRPRHPSRCLYFNDEGERTRISRHKY
jgi:hypothetical protein